MELVKDINPTGYGSPENFIEYNGLLYFSATNGVDGDELWVSDGTGGVHLQLHPGSEYGHPSAGKARRPGGGFSF